MNNLSDAVLSDAQRGAPDALSELYHALAPGVQAYLAAKGVAEPEAVTNDVFLAVLPRLPGVTGGVAGLRTLLFSVAHARMVDEHRARARRPAPVEYTADRDGRTAPSAEDEAHEHLASRRLWEVLAELPADQRDVVALRVVADLSVAEVAAIMGRSPGAVKQLQRRGLLRIRAALVEHGVGV